MTGLGATTGATTLLIMRHGDRLDYEVGKNAWLARATTSSALVASDPPLSTLGHRQASEVAAFLGASEKVDAIVTSPYLRALQTAQPLARATGLPLLVDWACAESHQKPSSLPPLDSRLPYFPEINEHYEPMMGTVITDGPDGREPGVEPRLEHMRRMLHLARALPNHPLFAGKTVAVFTHAASVALVAALTGTPSLDAAGKMAPCGVCKLVIAADGTSSLAASADETSGYLTAAAGAATGAWGFADSAEPLASAEAMWQEARRLGPTDLTALQVRLVDQPAAAAEDEAYEPESLVADRH